MINNKELIAPLLEFKEKGDFYMLYIFLRKKDQPQEVSSNHQSVRTIKSYCIESLEHLDRRWDEIVQLCEIFKARAYIHIQAQNHETVGLNMIQEIATRLKDGGNNFKAIFDSVVGQIKVREKRWIVDVDTDCPKTIWYIKKKINIVDPIGMKIICEIPTRNGLHLITHPFNSFEFKKDYPEVDIQKKNPTLLYYPNSLT